MTINSIIFPIASQQLKAKKEKLKGKLDNLTDTNVKLQSQIELLTLQLQKQFVLAEEKPKHDVLETLKKRLVTHLSEDGVSNLMATHPAMYLCSEFQENPKKLGLTMTKRIEFTRNI